MTQSKRILNGEDYLALPSSHTWLIEPLLPTSGAMLIYAEAKTGKAIHIDTPMLTPSGWRTMEDIQVDDQVFGANGQPTNVTAISPIQHNRPCYRVTFADDTSIIADAEHLWTVDMVTDGCRLKSNQTMTTQQMVELGTRVRKDDHLRFRVRLSQPVEFGQSPKLPLDPYCLGMWLGDGTRSNGQFTTADPELAETWRRAGWECIKQASNDYGYGVQRLHAHLRSMGVLNDKHIPQAYMTAALEDRRALLAGLVDTDGWANGRVGYFYNTNWQLAEQTYQLAVGLGCKVKIHEKRATLYGKDCGPCYFVSIRAPFNIFRLARKANKFLLNDEQYWSIDSIEPVPSVPVKCIVVDAADHLFLAGVNCIPTHNSYAALQLAQAVESGSEWLGFPCRKGNVVYIQLDTPRNVWQERIKKLRAQKAITHLPSFADNGLLDTWPFDILVPEHMIMLREALQEITRVDQLTGEESSVKPDLVIIDTFREAHSADENDSTEMQEAIAAMVAATQPSALVIISHARKPSQDSDFSLMGDNRGSSYVVGRMDGIVRFTPKSARIAGRSIEEHSIELERQDSGFWEVAQGDHDMFMCSLLMDASIPSLRQKAKVLHARIGGKSESACRGMLRRYQSAHPAVGSGVVD